MRSYCAIYVDAGYLLASAATRVTGTSLRRGVQVDHAKLVRGLIEQAESDSGMPLLRVNWYDSGGRPGGMPDMQQEDIGLLPRVKLRLGRLSHSGEQKGVDLRMGLDLATYGRNRVVDIIYLVSGDDDLTEAVEEAQFHGLQVIVLAVPDMRSRPYAVARNLQREADGVILLDAEVIDAAVKPVAIPAALIPGGDETGEAGQPDAVGELTEQLDAGGEPAVAGGEPAAGQPGSAPGVADTVPTPDVATPAVFGKPLTPAGGGGDIARVPAAAAASDGAAADMDAASTTPGAGTPGRPSRSVAGAAAAAAGGAGAGSPGAPDEAVTGQTASRHTAEAASQGTLAAEASDEDSGPGGPTPAVLAGKRPTAILPPKALTAPVLWSSNTGAGQRDEDPGITADLIDAVARQVVTSWVTSASPEALVELRRGEPYIPGDLDRTLLLDLASRSGEYDIDEVARHMLRERFWELVKRVKFG